MINDLKNSLKPFNREPISIAILNILIDYLLTGNLKPGSKLPTENEFAQKLGVGRNSVREAIKMLSSLGIIKTKKGAGTYIAETISPSALNPLIISLVFEQGISKELIELRLMIETGAAELAIEKASDNDIKRLENANNELKKAADTNTYNYNLLRDLDLKVHYTLFEITKNHLVAKLAKAIYRLFIKSIEKTLKIDPLKAYNDHKLYIDAIKNRDRLSVKKKINEALSYWKSSINDDV